MPVAASVLSAWGMLNTDLRVELSRSQGQSGEIDTAGLFDRASSVALHGRATAAPSREDMLLICCMHGCKEQ